MRCLRNLSTKLHVCWGRACWSYITKQNIARYDQVDKHLYTICIKLTHACARDLFAAPTCVRWTINMLQSRFTNATVYHIIELMRTPYQNLDFQARCCSPCLCPLARSLDNKRLGVHWYCIGIPLKFSLACLWLRCAADCASACCPFHDLDHDFHCPCHTLGGVGN